MTIAYIGLGSNIGNREENLVLAVEALRLTEGIEVVQVSSIYETDPVGYVDQSRFLNAVVEIDTTLTAGQLLQATKDIEKKYHRRREVRWGPRTIDLDILLFGRLKVDEDDLRLPHPEVANRVFVLAPLAEIAAEVEFPGGITVGELLEAMGEISGVELYSPRKLWFPRRESGNLHSPLSLRRAEGDTQAISDRCNLSEIASPDGRCSQ